MTPTHQKLAIQAAIQAFTAKPLQGAATALFATLGYTSDRTIAIDSVEHFCTQFDPDGLLAHPRAHKSEWKSIHLLFQLTDDELSRHTTLFKDTAVKASLLQSYVFFAIELQPGDYARGKLANITRQINRLFPMPVMVLFKIDTYLSMAVINRRQSKRDENQDVLGKVTLIQNISIAQPHPGHLDILASFSTAELAARNTPIGNFDQLHAAWEVVFNVELLNKRFYEELSNWYFWALTQVQFPKDAPKDADGRDSISLIRLITRIMFCWFLKEKGLLPTALFNADKMAALLGTIQPTQSTYYKAILQNLFFATLNQEMDKREFRRDGQNFMVHNLYRYRSLMTQPDEVLKLFAGIPFMNGGLFECLDKTLGTAEKHRYVRLDGFSDRDDNPLSLPNELFFGTVRTVDLSDAYGHSKFKVAKVAGLISILEGYKFTVTENTPIEQEVALDPELLGRVFENLLAAYNPETGATARKQTGSFYTPRDIVNYMVDESLIATLKKRLVAVSPDSTNTNDRLHSLFAYHSDAHAFTSTEVTTLIEAIDHLKIIDLACGSGAFPLGILHKLVFVLGKLDPGNQFWKARQLAKASEIPDAIVRERVMEDIENSFHANELDYGRKLYLIENCIYGADIQPIAVQITKLRFFISLIVEQRVHPHTPNLGIRPLPNLETKFVAANSLIGIDRPRQQQLRNPDIDAKEAELRRVRERHFLARTPAMKAKCREQDAALRADIAALLQGDGWSETTATSLAAWNPYDQNASADFFDLEWMFGLTQGFDVAIGNPPYVRADESSDDNKRQRERILKSGHYETLWEKWDLFVPFIEQGYKLLKDGGITTMIVSDAYCHSKYAQKSQNWFLKNSRVLQLDFCTDLKIFDAAVHNVIYFFQKADGTHYQPERRIHREAFGKFTLLPSDEQVRLTYRAFFPETKDLSISISTLPIETICYISYGLAANSDEKLYKGEFVTADVVQEYQDALHPKRYIEGKDIRQWFTPSHGFLEWGTERAPHKFRRQTFLELHEVAEKLMTIVVTVGFPPVMFDDLQRFTTHTSCIFVPWCALAGVRNNSLKKAARYRDETPSRPDLPTREELEATSRRFSVKYVLGVMNSSTARDFLRANRRSNIHLYPDDWKNLPIPDVSPAQQQPIVTLVNQILTAKRTNPSADISAFEARLNHAVALLYGTNS